MFGRRQRRAWFHWLGQLIWPRSGWRRASVYFSHRVRRLPGSPYNIAAGFAFGVAVSFTPLIGLHFVLAVVGAWIFGGNLIASALGTAIGNPWTFPLIWIASYRLGAWIMGIDSDTMLPEGLTMAFIRDNFMAVFVPMLIGGLIMAVVAWFGSFWLVRRAVARYQQMRLSRIRRRAGRRAEAQIRAKNSEDDRL
jgi:hypothetical protein